MCGICGIAYFDDRIVEINELRVINGEMKHRGPDDEGYYLDKNTAIAMRRLSIIDAEGGHQPISNEDGNVWVVLNGEIYNYIELRKDLKNQGHIFYTESDTEVIVHLYEDKGVEALEQLNGMFSFALYDVRLKALWIVRDRLGIKPLYYVHLKDRLVFTSDLNSLHRAVSLEINPESFLNYLGLAYVPKPDTIYKTARKLLPAHYLWIASGQVTCKHYWKLDKIQTWEGSYERAEEELENLLIDATRLQYRSDVPVGVFLSGGLDSSAIVALGTKSINRQINTLTINFDKKNGRDSQYAALIAKRYKTNHIEVDLSMQSFLSQIDELIPYLDEPIADTAIVPSFLLAKTASQNGIKVVLTGAGADELFGGYHRHLKPKLGSPRWVSENAPAPLRNTISRLWSLFNPNRGLRAGDPALAFGADSSGMGPDFYKNIMRDGDMFQKIIGRIIEHNKNVNSNELKGYAYSRMMMDTRNYLVDDVLCLTDKATMAASVEGRVPFLDHRIVEFAFSLPEEINIKENQAKGLFKKTLNKYLPEALINRKKEGFNAPINAWMSDSVVNQVRQELLEDTAPLVKEMVKIQVLEDILADKNRMSTACNSIFALYLFNRWWNKQLR